MIEWSRGVGYMFKRIDTVKISIEKASDFHQRLLKL